MWTFIDLLQKIHLSPFSPLQQRQKKQQTNKARDVMSKKNADCETFQHLTHFWFDVFRHIFTPNHFTGATESLLLGSANIITRLKSFKNYALIDLVHYNGSNGSGIRAHKHSSLANDVFLTLLWLSFLLSTFWKWSEWIYYHIDSSILKCTKIAYWMCLRKRQHSTARVHQQK